MDKYKQILNYIFQSAWAMHIDKLDGIMAIMQAHGSGLFVDSKLVNELKAEHEQRRKVNKSDSIGIIPIFGMLAQKMNMFMEISGGTSTEMTGNMIDALVEDESIKAIILDIDSGGGEVAGVEALSDKIFQARETKPIIAVANSFAASGAYWIASAATEVVAAPGSIIGSIGVYMMHREESEKLSSEGIKYTIIKAGENKAETNPVEPLTDTAKANLQSLVDSAYGAFTASLARNRNTSVAKVLKSFGQGTVFHPEQAQERNMIDRVATLQQVLDGQAQVIEAKATSAVQVKQMRLKMESHLLN